MSGPLVLSALLFLLDRVCKQLVVSYVQESIYINTFFSIVKTYNQGIVCGLFNWDNFAMYCLVSGSIVVVYSTLIYTFSSARHRSSAHQMAFWLIAFGGLSNLFDRVAYGGVVDFISLSYAAYYWPTFNIADISIVCGFIAMMLSEVIHEK